MEETFQVATLVLILTELRCSRLRYLRQDGLRSPPANATDVHHRPGVNLVGGDRHLPVDGRVVDEEAGAYMVQCVGRRRSMGGGWRRLAAMAVAVAVAVAVTVALGCAGGGRDAGYANGDRRLDRSRPWPEAGAPQ